MGRIKEKIILKVLFPIADKVMGTCAMEWLKQISEMNVWSRHQIEVWQASNLKKLILHAYEHTEFYRKTFDSLGITPDDIQTKEDLTKLPILTKDIIQSHYKEFIPNNISNYKYRKARTGGTTGLPMKYLCDENTWGYVTAAKIYYWTKTSFNYGDTFAALGSSSLFHKKNPLLRRIYDRMRHEIGMNCIDMDEVKIQKFISIIKKKNIKYIYGYAAAIYTFARYVADNHIDLRQIEWVFCSSENLTDGYRETIERTFDCKIMDCYGAKDAGITAYEQGYHRYQVGYNVIAEICNQVNETTGTLLSTNLFSFSFPLIRYAFGDEASLSNDNSDYNGQVITEVLGRTSDVMRLSNGKSLTSTGISMIMKKFDVIAFDFNLQADNIVKLRLQPNPHLYDIMQEKQIIDIVSSYLGDGVSLKIEYVDHFEPLKNGKRRYFMNC